MNDKIRAHMALVDEFAGNRAHASCEHLYGTSDSYTKWCFEQADKSRAAVESSAIALHAEHKPLFVETIAQHPGLREEILAEQAGPTEFPYPAATTIEGAAQDVAKWLNERPNRPIDLRHVAMLVHAVQQAEPGFVPPPEPFCAIGYEPEPMEQSGAIGLVAISVPAARPSEPPKAKQPDDLHIAYMAGFADGKKARPAVEPRDERAEFEAWSDRGFVKAGHAKHHRYNDGYCTAELQSQWKAWQARASKGST